MGIKTTLSDKDRKDVSIVDFSQCHAAIISYLMVFCGLPALLERALLEPNMPVRTAAEEALHFFRAIVFKHHAEEERDLFPAVLAAAAQGEELEWVRSIVERLTREHREVEAMWATLEPELKKIAKGQRADLDASVVEALVLDYGAHAAFEEAQFLPRCCTILGRGGNRTRSLDLSHPMLKSTG